ncbi:MAG: MMPL family transporter [Candidatus Marinimicrobia bacterium]|nr:MMPL family transporter [Candidatus Neomarinimicrobiota bacterium]MBT5116048.1 MMPL family transporter [Candidatus Neomarinimicrobiota bacterium]MBT5748223.1 MMPL family transporter [Candidatus Neomarinimicrobiota bacterium]MBT6412885.1 MMPL family transporter [Candidatus Neomarinimicrobiota bacterium]MBT6867350.1 MMPL family transporter [Candidatus Neomarinimicrobiota bacterium]
MKNTLLNYSDHPVRQWFIRQSLDRPIRVIILSVIATIIMGFGLQFFVVDDDVMKMLPKNLESRLSWDALQDEFGSTEMIFIAFGHKNKTIFTPDAFATAWDLADQLETSQKVEEVTSVSRMNRMDNIDGFMEVGDLQPDRELSQVDVDNIKDYLDRNKTIKTRLISEKDEYIVVIIQPYDTKGLDVFRNEVVAITKPILKGYEIHYGGNAYVTGTMPEMIREDVQGLMKMGMLIMVSILLLNLRSPKGVALVMMVIGLSLVAMMGFMGWIYRLTGSERFLFTMANTSMPIILLTIANSDGVHVVTKYFKELRSKNDVRLAVASTMDSLLIPIFLTSITTIAAFLTMISSPLEPMIGYGVTIGVGITWAWFLSSLMLPAVISLLKWDANSNAISKPSLFERGIDKLGKLVLSHPKYVFSSGAIFVIIGLFGLMKVTVDVNMASMFKPGTEIRDSMDFMDEELTGTMDIRARIEGDMKDPGTLADMIALQDFMEIDEKVTISYSIGNVVEQMHRTVMDDDIAFETIPENREKVNNLFTMYSMSGDPDDFSSMVDYNYEVGLVTALSKIMSTDDIFSYVEKIDAYIDENFNPELKINVTGMMVVFRDLVTLIIKSSIFSITFSLFVIGVIASIFFKRILWGFLAVIPLSSAVIINFGFMGYFGIELSHITALLSSIIIGVGVDFSIHYIAQFRRLSRTVSADKLSREVVDDVGYPIILDAASNMGFGALLFSAFLPIQYIGGLMVFAMMSTSLGTLTVLAALAELLKKKLIGRS